MGDWGAYRYETPCSEAVVWAESKTRHKPLGYLQDIRYLGQKLESSQDPKSDMSESRCQGGLKHWDENNEEKRRKLQILTSPRGLPQKIQVERNFVGG